VARGIRGNCSVEAEKWREAEQQQQNENEKHRWAELRWLREERRIRAAYPPAEGSIRCQFRRMRAEESLA